MDVSLYFAAQFFSEMFAVTAGYSAGALVIIYITSALARFMFALFSTT